MTTAKTGSPGSPLPAAAGGQAPPLLAGGEHAAPRHVGIEEVEAALQVVGPLLGVVRDRGSLGHVARALLVEEVEVELVGMAGRQRPFGSGLGGTNARAGDRRGGVGKPRKSLERVRTHAGRTLLV